MTRNNSSQGGESSGKGADIRPAFPISEGEDAQFNVLFVCSSNVCRSPYCEFVLKRMVREDDELRGKVNVSSAGVVNRSRALFPKGRDRLLREGFSTEELDAFKPCYKSDGEDRFAAADVIIGMSRFHKLFVKSKYRGKFVTLSMAATGKHSPIPDPFLGSERSYNATMDRLRDFLSAYFAKLKTILAK